MNKIIALLFLLSLTVFNAGYASEKTMSVLLSGACAKGLSLVMSDMAKSHENVSVCFFNIEEQEDKIRIAVTMGDPSTTYGATVYSISKQGDRLLNVERIR